MSEAFDTGAELAATPTPIPSDSDIQAVSASTDGALPALQAVETLELVDATAAETVSSVDAIGVAAPAAEPLASNDAASALEAVEPAAPAEPAKPNGFVALGLAPELVAAVADLGFDQPTQVQSITIPKALRGDASHYADLMVSSQTGSGKTAAFLLPVLHTLLLAQQKAEADARAEFDRQAEEAASSGQEAPKRPKRKDPTNPRHFKAPTPGALILCPTRELAQQVADDAIDLVRHCRGLRIACVVGGMPYPVQIARLQNANLVVATPGRLLDLQRSQQLKLDQVQFLVVDEADRMLDLGFSDDLAEVNDLTSQRGQTMMFSATFAPRIQQLAMRVMHDQGKNVQKIQIDSPQEKHVNIKQTLYWADNAHHKRKLLDHWLRDTSINQAIVFASTQIECDGLANDLQQEGFSAVALHGALSQGLRNRRLMALRNGQVQILVATDVAARGIDVPTITHVFNFGLPMKAEDYTHRIGRTGRAGRDGLAITFAELRDRRKIGDIEAYGQQRIKVEVVPGLEPQQRAPQAAPWGKPAGRPSGPRGNDRFADRSNDRFAERRGPPAGDRRFEDRGPARGPNRTPGGGFAGFGRNDAAPRGRGFDAAPAERGRGFEAAPAERGRGFDAAPPRGRSFDAAPPRGRSFDAPMGDRGAPARRDDRAPANRLGGEPRRSGFDAPRPSAPRRSPR